MSEPSPDRRIDHFDDAGRRIASAHLRMDPDSATAEAAIQIEAGHRPPDAGSRLVEEALDSAGIHDADRVIAVLPKGEAGALIRTQELLEGPATRTAGASVIVEGDPPAAASRPGRGAQGQDSDR